MSTCYPIQARVCYPQMMDYNKIMEDIRRKEWEKVYNKQLEEYRRRMLYQLQWGTPTGPYWTNKQTPIQIMLYNRYLR
jgi:hypothetical protein